MRTGLLGFFCCLAAADDLSLTGSGCVDLLARGLARVAGALGVAMPVPAAVDLLSATGRVSDFLLLPGCFRGNLTAFSALAVALALLDVAFVMMPQAQVLQAYRHHAFTPVRPPRTTPINSLDACVAVASTTAVGEGNTTRQFRALHAVELGLPFTEIGWRFSGSTRATSIIVDCSQARVRTRDRDIRLVGST